MSLFDLSGKVAVVTGSTKGIGKAIAERMAEQGARVVISSRNQDLCDDVATSIVSKGGHAVGISCNINHKEQLESLVEKTNSVFGDIDVLVCNAALNPYFGPSQEIPDQAFDKVMHANIGSVHRLCQLVIPNMKKLGGGSVVIISSLTLLTVFSLAVLYLIKSSIVPIFNLCFLANVIRSFFRAIVPSSFKISTITADGSSPANFARSHPASV